jgi:Ran GTPase-activating protein (RanGAP) involved in mRNA processing and transport
MQSLSRHQSLQSLLLEGNRIGDNGCAAVAEAIQGRRKELVNGLIHLTHIDLSYNNIGDAGCRLLAASVQQLPALQALHMHANALGDQAIAELHCSLTRFCPSVEDVLQFSMESTQAGWPFHKAQP